MTAKDIHKILSGYKFSFDNERKLQQEIFDVLIEKCGPENVKKEHYLDEKKRSKPDFFLFGSIAIEVKIKETARKIYDQCERYCGFDQVKELLLVTNKSMGFPQTLNGKDCYVLKLGMAWL